MAIAKSTRAKRSKAEVEEEFEFLVEEAGKKKASSSNKIETAAQIEEMEVKNAVSGITVEIVAQKLSLLNVEISKTLSNLSEKMTSEANLLHSLQEAVNLESKELNRLHGIDIAATNLDQLLSDYQAKKDSLGRELLQIQQEIVATRENSKREEAESLEALKKNRVREQEEYEYKKNLERKKLQDRFEEECALREKQNRDAQETLEKTWKARETELELKEEEFISLKKEVEQFPSRLATDCAKVAKEVTKEIEAKYSQEVAQLKRDLSVEKQIGELKIHQLEELLANQQTQITILQAQLEEAKKQVQDIAVKAIEGASGSRALSHINQIAIEQAKNRTSNT
ncbi:MAG: hypothetical protein LVR00_07980 [Rhabdochlamydiaceae bacterium]|jgi:hypothetical protein